MNQWEYLRLSVSKVLGVTRAKRINGEEIKNWKKGPDVTQYLNDFGSEGWELCTMGFSTDGNGVNEEYDLFFKRIMS